MRVLRRIRSDDSGMTLVDVLISMVLMLVVGGVMVSGFISSNQVFRATNDESAGQTDVRTTIERLGRDIRNARSLEPGATQSQLVLWIDGNSDYKKQSDEVVTWQLVANADGKFDVTRLRDGNVLRTARLVISQIAFCYRENGSGPCLATPLTADQAEAIRVVTAEIEYDANLDRGLTSRSTTFSERLRNVE